MNDVVRYSESFKRQVVREIEEGIHPGYGSAPVVYGIRGSGTAKNRVMKYGKTHLLKNVLRVESKEERSELEILRRRVRSLESALSDAHLYLRLEKAYLAVACEVAGIDDVEHFKKKADTARYTKFPMAKEARMSVSADSAGGLE